jgi:hypothetical protein
MGVQITGEGPAFQPEVLLWLSPDGLVLASTLARPGEVARQAGSLLTQAMHRPLAGGRSRPEGVRVASAELAEAVRSAHPGIAVRIAPTPEIDAVGAEMTGALFGGGGDSATYLTPDVEPAAMAALFRAAAALYRAKPWSVVPDDQCLLYATCAAFEMRDAPISVIGQAGESFGFITFADVESFGAFIDAAEWRALGESPELVPHLALSFEKRKEMPPRMLREITAHGWETAGPSATPLLGPVGEEGLRAAGPEDVHRLEVLALALLEAVRDRKALLASWSGGEAWARTFVVTSHRGDVEVHLATSFEVPPQAEAQPFGVLAELHDLAHDELVFEGGEPDDERRRELDDELQRDFSRSPEAAEAGATEPGWIGLVLDMAASNLGDTVATLGPRGLREVLFELVPRKVMVGPEVAREIVAELRAFYAISAAPTGTRRRRPACACWVPVPRRGSRPPAPTTRASAWRSPSSRARCATASTSPPVRASMPGSAPWRAGRGSPRRPGRPPRPRGRPPPRASARPRARRAARTADGPRPAVARPFPDASSEPRRGPRCYARRGGSPWPTTDVRAGHRARSWRYSSARAIATSCRRATRSGARPPAATARVASARGSPCSPPIRP